MMKISDNTKELRNSFRGNVTLNERELSSIGTIHDYKRGNCEVSALPYVLDENKKALQDMKELMSNCKFDLHDLNERKAYGNLLSSSFTGDRDSDSWKDLCNYMTFVINSDIFAAPWALSAFQIINLQPDQLPLIEFPRSANYQHFAVRSVSLNGTTEYDQWRETKDILQLDMDMVGTPRVEFSTRNLQIGDINAARDLENFIQRDLDLHVDGLAKDNIDAAGVETGLRDTLNLHPNVVPANIPDANMLDLTGSDPGVLTLPKLKTIVAHMQSFGYAGGVDEQFQMNAMHISPQNIRDPWDYISLVSGWDTSNDLETKPGNTVPSSVRDQIFNSGMITNAWGSRFSWVPNIQLAKGWLYITTNKPLGWMFRKPEFDQFWVWDARTNPEYAINENGEIMAKRALRFYVPDLWRQRILIVQF